MPGEISDPLRVAAEALPPAGAGDAAHFKYWAFISYSHRDKAWAEWLHRKLETYRVPRALAGRPSRNGPIPPRLAPIFRDRDELSAAHDLGLYIKSSLVLSRHLIVICSPNASQSVYVDEEIRYFKSLGREDRVLCLIVAGEPEAGKRLGNPALECFPPSLQFRVMPDGQLGEEIAQPVAADARPHGDGRTSAFVKLLAGLLDVNYDVLAQRERVRRLRRRLRVALMAALVVGAFLSVFTYEEDTKRAQTTREYLNSAEQAEKNGRLTFASIFLAAAYHAGGQGKGDDTEWRERLLHDSRCLITEAAILRGHDDWVDCVSFSPDGRRLLSASWDGSVRVWDLGSLPVANATALHSLRPGTHDVFLSAAFNPAGDRIVCTTWWSALCWVADLRGAVQGRVIDDHRGRVNDAEFSARGDRIVTASDDCTARLWTPDGAAIATFAGHDAGVKTAVFNPEGTRVLTASYDGTAVVWDAATGRIVARTPPHRRDPKPLNCASFSPDGKRFVTAGLDGKARVYDAAGVRLLTFAEHHGRINSAVFSHRGDAVLTAGDDGTAKIWDAADGTLRYSLEGHQGTVLAAAFSPDAQWVATAGNDHTVRLWRLSDAAPAEIGWQEFDARVAALPWALERNQIREKNAPARRPGQATAED